MSCCPAAPRPPDNANPSARLARLVEVEETQQHNRKAATSHDVRTRHQDMKMRQRSDRHAVTTREPDKRTRHKDRRAESLDGVI